MAGRKCQKKKPKEKMNWGGGQSGPKVTKAIPVSLQQYWNGHLAKGLVEELKKKRIFQFLYHFVNVSLKNIQVK